MGFFDGLVASATKDPLKAISSIGSAVAPIIGAAGSLFGQSSANQANKDLADQANAFNAAQSKVQMEFQERMRSTQYQTAVKDLQAAGLNPMLAYAQGGAGNLSGASASAVAPPKMENVVANAANSALTTMQLNTNLKQNALLDAQINKTDTESDNIQADTLNKFDTNPNIKAENKRILADLALKDTQAKLNVVTAKNVRENIAPSVDPYWYRDAKKSLTTAKDFLQLKHLQGK